VHAHVLLLMIEVLFTSCPYQMNSYKLQAEDSAPAMYNPDYMASTVRYDSHYNVLSHSSL